MTSMLRFAWISLLAAGLATHAGAINLPFTGTLSVQSSPLLDPLVITGAGSASISTPGGTLPGPLTALTVPASAFSGGDFAFVTDPAASPIRSWTMTATNAAGAFGGAPLSGPMGLSGAMALCFFSTCPPTIGEPGLTIPFGSGGEGVGVGGAVTAFGFGIKLTVVGAPWTAGTASAGSGPISGPYTTQTVMGFAHGPASLASSNAAASGVVSLVTPIRITSSIGPSGSLPAFARLTLHFEAPAACGDGLDNDGDGEIDFGQGCAAPGGPDCGCSSFSDTSELDETGTYLCDDGSDNDGDSLIDAADDPGCCRPSSLTESPQCNDGMDNDGAAGIDFDGGALASQNGALCTGPATPFDCCTGAGTGCNGPADPQCVSACTGKEKKGCGLGFELALLLLPLMAHRRHRRL